MKNAREDLREFGLVHGVTVGLVFAFFLAAAVSELLAV